MKTRYRIARTTYLAYLAVLATLALLGAFVAALAFGSELAIVPGIAMLVSFGIAIVGFRAGGAQLSLANEEAEQKLSVWVDPLREAQLARYRATYRGEPEAPEAVVPQRVTDVEKDTTREVRAAA